MIFEDWGLISYEQAMNKQLEYVDKLDQLLTNGELHPGFLIFCSHPAVVTTGRQTQPTDIFAWQGPIIEVSTGNPQVLANYFGGVVGLFFILSGIIFLIPFSGNENK